MMMVFPIVRKAVVIPMVMVSPIQSMTILTAMAFPIQKKALVIPIAMVFLIIGI